MDPWLVVILLIVLVIVFGAGRLAQVTSAMGRSVREFRSAVSEDPHTHAAPAPPPAPSVPPVICAECQTSNPGANKFCSSCGASLVAPAAAAVVPAPAPPAESTCPSCATVNPPGQAFCGQCGTRLTRAA